MDTSALDHVATLIEQEPRAARSLVLYALMSTLAIDNSGSLFKLTKLRELDAETRALAYGLMEVMAQGATGSPAWQAAMSRIEQAIRRA
ncbi:MAG: hypothetical protein P8076_07140 [Gammaproteobacteria bacterium]